jgi:hypothetical protein
MTFVPLSRSGSGQTVHDCAALVGYMRLPEGYTDYLIDVALEADLAQLRVTQSWFDHVLKQQAPTAAALQEIAAQIEERIGHLRTRLNQAQDCGRKGVLEENLGLLGSGEKRLAEVYFRLRQIESSAQWRALAAEALKRSLAYYTGAFRPNLAHHWSGVQMLSLQAVTEGRIPDNRYRHAAVLAAQNALSNETEYWAVGSLLELFLLAPYAGQPPSLDKARQYARALAERIAKITPDPRRALRYRKHDPATEPLQHMVDRREWIFPDGVRLSSERERLSLGVAGGMGQSRSCGCPVWAGIRLNAS